MERHHPTDWMSTNAEDSDDGDEEQLETRAVGGENFARGTSTAQQSLFVAVSSDSGVLSRQGTMNSHVNDTQFFMGMAGEGRFSRSHLPSVSQCRAFAGDDRMKQRSQAELVREKNCGITSFALQSLLAAASGDSDALSRQGIVNSYVNGAQSFMSMANPDPSIAIWTTA